MMAVTAAAPTTIFSSNNSSSKASTAKSQESDKLESWVDWIQRVTADATTAMEKAGVPDWVEEQQKRKLRWCGHVARRFDGRWTTRILNWTPAGGHRSQGHPVSRWLDDINAFALKLEGLDGSADTAVDIWWAVAQNREVWSSIEQDYVNFLKDRW